MSASLVLGACHRRAENAPNVLLVTIDTLRADRLGCYGFGPAHTPALDRLAAEGVRCADVAAVAPITLPSHISILTGLYPPAHSVRDNGAYALNDRVVTLAERLKTAGYETQAFVSAAVLDRRYNLTQGFDGYDDDLSAEDAPPMFMVRDRPAPRTVGRVLSWLAAWRARPHRPFFAWVHFYDPHQPYEPHTRRAALAPTPYDAEITTVDEAIGRLRLWLEEAGELDSTLVVVTADHGESLDEHQEKTHALFIYDATIRVPLLWRYPAALPRGRVYEPPVSSVDIAPTILEALGLPVTAAPMQGRSLWGALRGGAAAAVRPQYCESLLPEVGFGMAPLLGLRADGFKYIRAPRPELYDLRRDPHELHDLLAPATAVGAEAEHRARVMGAALDRILADSEALAQPRGASVMDRESTEMLMALGYLAPSDDRAGMSGIDPKDGIVVYNALESARHRAQAHDWRGAVAILEPIVAKNPGSSSALNILALAETALGDAAAARRAYAASLAANPDQFRVHAMLGQLDLQHRDLAGAARHFEDALGLMPGFSEAMGYLSYIAAQRGRASEAQDWLRRARAADPGFDRFYRRLGDLSFLRGDYADALAQYRRLLSAFPDHFPGLVQASLAAHRLGDEGTAEVLLERAARARPDSWIPPFNLACYRSEAGRKAQALAALARAVDAGLSDVGVFDTNPELSVLRGEPAFTELRNRVAAAGRAAPRAHHGRARAAASGETRPPPSRPK